MAVYNTSRFIDGLLKTHETSPPSFTVRLYREHWTLNNGSKFLYNNQIASLLDDIRTRHIPVDFLELFDTAKLPFYEGCLIVELLDYRPNRSSDPELEQPEASRVVLTPNDESRWTDICLMNQKTGLTWTDADSIEVEARLLMATAPPLCLAPDVQLTRIVNATQRTTTPPVPPTLKRKASAMDQEADEIEKARRVKITQFMNPRGRSTVPTYRILDAIQKAKLAKEHAPPPPQATQPIHPTIPTTASPRPQATTPAQSGPAPTPTPAPAPIQYQHPPNASSPAPSAAGTPPSGGQDPKKLAKRNSVAGQSPRIPRASATPAPTAPSGAPLPIPPHLQQHYQAQIAQRTATPTPSQAAASPRPPPQALAHASSPAAAPEQRPPSAVPTAPAQSVQPTPAQVQHHIQQQAAAAARALSSPAPMQTPQQPPMQGGYPAHIPAAVIMAHQLARRKAQAAAAGAANAGTPVPGGPSQVQNYMHAQAQAQYLAAYQHAQAQQHQRITQSQQAASPAARTQTPAAQVQAAVTQAQRNSPMVANQTLASRSPMPNPAQQPTQMAQAQAHAQAQQQQQRQQQQQAQQPQQQAQPQAQSHPQPQVQQHPQHPQHPQQQQQQHPTTQQQQQQQHLAYAQYMQRMAQVQAAQAHAQQHPQMQQHFAAGQAGAAQGGMQPQQAAAAAMQNPQMMAQYYYNARMPGVAMGQMPQAYWPLGAGRGMPIAGMPGAHPQQMQPGAGGGAGKPAQGGQQGS